MTRLTDLLNGVVPPTVNHPPAAPRPLIDNCGCIKGPGCYGREGWHLRPYGKSDIEHDVSRALAELPQGSPDEDRRGVEAGAIARHQRYTGTPLAYERCPAWMAVVAAACLERRLAKAKAKKDSAGTNNDGFLRD